MHRNLLDVIRRFLHSSSLQAELFAGVRRVTPAASARAGASARRAFQLTVSMSRTGLRVATSKVVTVDSTNKEELQLAAGVELTDGDSIVIEAEVNRYSLLKEARLVINESRRIEISYSTMRRLFDVVPHLACEDTKGIVSATVEEESSEVVEDGLGQPGGPAHAQDQESADQPECEAEDQSGEERSPEQRKDEAPE